MSYHIFSVTLLLLGTSIKAQATTTGSMLQITKAEHSKITSIVRSLQECPVWTGVPNSQKQVDAETQRQIFHNMRHIALYNTNTIAEALKQFLRESPPLDNDPPAKIYLLNRFLFTVPTFATKDRFPGFPSYGCLVGPRPHNGLYDEMWPLTRNSKGQFEILGAGWNIAGYSGPALRGTTELNEFQYFSRHYKRRTRS